MIYLQEPFLPLPGSSTIQGSTQDKHKAFPLTSLGKYCPALSFLF